MSYSFENIKSDLKDYQEVVRKYSKADVGKAIFEMLKTYLPFFVLFILSAFIYEYSILLSVLISVFAGFFLVRIFIIQHDCGHQSFMPHRKANNIIGFISSFFTLIPYKYWAKSHNYHHAHQGLLQNRTIGDISLLTVEQYSKLNKWGRLKYKVYRSPISLFLIGPMYYIFIHNRIPFIALPGWNKAKRSLWLTNIYLALFYVGLGYLIGFQKIAILYFPVLFVFGIISVWFFYVQHQHNPNYKSTKKDWDFVVAAIRGSSFYKLPRILHFFSGNIGYHHIHHLASKIPYYNLPKCSEENPVFQKHVPTIGFLASMKIAFYHLWNEQTQQMISFRQYRKSMTVQKVKI